MDKFRIVADSSADVLELKNVPFAAVPLKIITAEKEYTDNKDLDVQDMVNTLLSYKGRSSTSCPNPEDWLRAFGDAEYIFCIPITATLSGSYNAANIAKDIYENMYPDRKVFVLNTLTTGPEMKLIAEKIEELIIGGMKYDAICAEILKYMGSTGLLFMLESLRNFANNGRVSPIVAKAAGLLGVRIVGQASDHGDLQILDKCRGQEKALKSIVNYLKQNGLSSGKVYIAHCFNEEGGLRLKEMLINEIPKIKVDIYNLRGLCSFYAEQGGLLVGYERF